MTTLSDEFDLLEYELWQVAPAPNLNLKLCTSAQLPFEAGESLRAKLVNESLLVFCKHTRIGVWIPLRETGCAQMAALAQSRTPLWLCDAYTYEGNNRNWLVPFDL